MTNERHEGWFYKHIYSHKTLRKITLWSAGTVLYLAFLSLIRWGLLAVLEKFEWFNKAMGSPSPETMNAWCESHPVMVPLLVLLVLIALIVILIVIVARGIKWQKDMCESALKAIYGEDEEERLEQEEREERKLYRELDIALKVQWVGWLGDFHFSEREEKRGSLQTKALSACRYLAYYRSPITENSNQEAISSWVVLHDFMNQFCPERHGEDERMESLLNGLLTEWSVKSMLQLLNWVQKLVELNKDDFAYLHYARMDEVLYKFKLYASHAKVTA